MTEPEIGPVCEFTFRQEGPRGEVKEVKAHGSRQETASLMRAIADCLDPPPQTPVHKPGLGDLFRGAVENR